MAVLDADVYPKPTNRQIQRAYLPNGSGVPSGTDGLVTEGYCIPFDSFPIVGMPPTTGA